MAVTQQLARLSLDHLETCRASIGALDAVCSFTALPEDDYLDLNWYPSVLLNAIADEQIDPDLHAALNLALNGRTEVNPAYREVPDSIWEHPVNSLIPAEVADVSASLSRLATGGFPRSEHGMDGLVAAFRSLVDFYIKAAEQQLSVVMWWD